MCIGFHYLNSFLVPGAPRGLTAKSGTPERISVSWLAPSAGKISRYVIVYSADDQERKKLNATTRNESYELDRLSPYTYYRIEVKAEGGNASAVTFAYTLEGSTCIEDGVRLFIFFSVTQLLVRLDRFEFLTSAHRPSFSNGNRLDSQTVGSLIRIALLKRQRDGQKTWICVRTNSACRMVDSFDGESPI